MNDLQPIVSQLIHGDEKDGDHQDGDEESDPDQHPVVTREELQSLGYDEEHIEQLVEERIIGVPHTSNPE